MTDTHQTTRTYERSSTDLDADPGLGLGYFTFYQIAAAVFRAVPDLERVILTEVSTGVVEVRTPGFVVPPEAIERVDEKRAIATAIYYSASLGGNDG